ncbi:MAG: ADOP family duplicated permease [Candidatus Acidiferrales bacterium]
MHDPLPFSEQSPRLARGLLRLGLRGAAREAVMGDLEEEFHRHVLPEIGPRTARRWYWQQALHSVATRWMRGGRRERNEMESSAEVWRRECDSYNSFALGANHNEGERIMQGFWQDVRYGARMLAKNPGFTAVTALILALGIGANAAIFSVVDAVLLRPLPFSEPERLVALWQNNRKDNVEREDVAPANFVDWRAQNTVFSEVAALNPWSLDYTGGSEPETIHSANVTRGFFEILGVQAWRGRTFVPEEYEPGKNRVVVLTHGLWQRKFGGDPGVVGQVISLDNQSHSIVGILPPEFFLRFGREADGRVRKPEMYAPQVVAGEDWESRVSTYLEVVARLQPGVTLEEARAAMNVVGARLAEQYPRENGSVGVTVVPLHDQMVGAVRPGLLILLGGVGLVLLIACANVANLLLARGHNRMRELAVRAALGAGRSRLIGQLVTEGFLLSLLGLMGGLLLAWALIPAIVSLGPADTPRIQDVSLNVSVLGFAMLTALVTGVLFGVLPSLQLTRGNLQNFLKEGTKGVLGRSGASRLRGALVVSEVALAMVLLVGAGLLMRSFFTLLGVDRGFSHNAVALEVYVWDRYETPERRIAYFRDVAEKLRTLPGVKAAGAVSSAPFLTSGHAPSIACNVVGRPPLPPDQAPTVYSILVTPDYFRAMGIPLLSGRDVREADDAKAPRVALINTTMARQLWGQEDPLGRKFNVTYRQGTFDFEVIGVVGDARHRLDLPPRPEFYRSHAQGGIGSMTIVVGTESDPTPMMAAIKQKVWEVNPTQPFYNETTLRQLVEGSLAGRRFQLVLLAGFSVLALVLAAVGIYGVISFLTVQRTHEIGVRVALGAQRGDILQMVFRHGVRLAGVGVVVGIAAALAATRLMRSLLFEVTAADPVTYIVIGVLLLAVALVACWLPARRATRVDPMVALRYE